MSAVCVAFVQMESQLRVPAADAERRTVPEEAVLPVWRPGHLAGLKLIDCTQSDRWRFHTGAEGAQAPKSWLAPPPNLAVLLTHCGQLILRKKLVDLMPSDVRF